MTNPTETARDHAEAEYQRFMDKEHDHPCEYGHIGCSYEDGGPCFDEFLANHPELDEAAS